MQQIAQLPTPTAYAFPVGTPAINLDMADVGLWAYTDDVINVWNYQENFGLMVQWAIIAIMVIAFLGILYRLIQGTIERDRQ